MVFSSVFCRLMLFLKFLAFLGKKIGQALESKLQQGYGINSACPKMAIKNKKHSKLGSVMLVVIQG